MHIAAVRRNMHLTRDTSPINYVAVAAKKQIRSQLCLLRLLQRADLKLSVPHDSAFGTSATSSRWVGLTPLVFL
jgi:hypothetical protein